MLKEKLKTIKKNNGSPIGEDSFQLALEMMQHMGSTDLELRDHLIYSILSHWIHNQVFSEEQVKELLHLSIDDSHLFYLLGESNTDSVFTRSFSILITASILFLNNKKEFLSDEEVHKAKERVIQYAKEEKDIRGYVEGKGWAHPIAHLADCLNGLATSKSLNDSDLREILEIVQLRILEPEGVFICEEDERMVTSVY